MRKAMKRMKKQKRVKIIVAVLFICAMVGVLYYATYDKSCYTVTETSGIEY